MVPMSRELYYIVTMYKYYQLTLFLVLIGKFDQKPNFQPRLASTRPYKIRIGNNHGENMVPKVESSITLFSCTNTIN